MSVTYSHSYLIIVPSLPFWNLRYIKSNSLNTVNVQRKHIDDHNLNCPFHFLVTAMRFNSICRDTWRGADVDLAIKPELKLPLAVFPTETKIWITRGIVSG